MFYNESHVAIPDAFELEQNYPNPFNPSTTITFALPQSQTATLVIYNAIGQEIKRLVNGKMDAGYHEVKWKGLNSQGAKVASGVYFYQLITPSKIVSKKMILLK